MGNNNFQKQTVISKVLLASLWVVIGILGRLVPHIPDVTPLTSLCLLSSSFLNRRIAFVFMLFTVVLSDSFLAWFYGYPAFGLWTIFTYSGFAGIVLLGYRLTKNVKLLPAIAYILIATLAFWFWTDLGVWLTSGLYPSNLVGLLACYVAALPFLHNAVLGSLGWMLVLFGVFRCVTLPINGALRHDHV